MFGFKGIGSARKPDGSARHTLDEAKRISLRAALDEQRAEAVLVANFFSRWFDAPDLFVRPLGMYAHDRWIAVRLDLDRLVVGVVPHEDLVQGAAREILARVGRRVLAEGPDLLTAVIELWAAQTPEQGACAVPPAPDVACEPPVEDDSADQTAAEGARLLAIATATSLSACFADDYRAAAREHKQADQLQQQAYLQLAAVPLERAQALVEQARDKYKRDQQLWSSIRVDAQRHAAARAQLVAEAQAGRAAPQRSEGQPA